MMHNVIQIYEIVLLIDYKLNVQYRIGVKIEMINSVDLTVYCL